MSNSKTGWLNDNPLNGEAGGPGLLTNAFLGSVVLKQTQLTFLYNLMISPNWASILMGSFGEPKEWVNRLMVYPFPVPSLPIKKYLKFGPVDTGGLSGGDSGEKVECYESLIGFPGGNKLRSMGSTYIAPYFNNFMDYNGYTYVELYLPFCGKVDVQTNDVMGKYLYVDLFIDYYTGQGIYYISVNENANAETSDRRIILKKECQLGYQIPLGGTNAGEALRNMLIGTVKTSAIAAIGMTMMSSTTTSTGSKVASKETQRRGMRKDSQRKVTSKSAAKTESTKSSITRQGAGTIAAAAVGGSFGALTNINTTPEYDRVNNTILDLASSKSVKVVIKRPKPIPVGPDFNKIYGRPAAYTERLGELTGYTKITGIHLENFNEALATELEILDDALKDGVILDGDNEVIFPPDVTEGPILATSDDEYVLTRDNEYIELEE